VLAKLKARLGQGGFARNVATLAGGAAVAQFLPVLFAAADPAACSPADFGVLTQFVAWLSNLVVIATWRYDMAVVLPEEDADAMRLMVLALLFNTLLLAVLSIPCWPPGRGLPPCCMPRPWHRGCPCCRWASGWPPITRSGPTGTTASAAAAPMPRAAWGSLPPW
jgi:hypothetical protein